MARRFIKPLAIATRLLAIVLGTSVCVVDAAANEVCRFVGTTDYDGSIAVTTDVAATNGVTRVDVVLTFKATMMLWPDIQYLVEEISIWRGEEMESVAVNTRHLVGHHIVRQQWDTFERSSNGLQARRVQAKTLDDFRRRHPGFIRHWDPATFGQPWLQDYASAPPERRADLDLKISPLHAGLRSPLAMAFYWTRWLPPDGRDVSVFLPGFKAENVVKMPIDATSSASGKRWRAVLRYSLLSEWPASTATAWISPNGHLLELAFEVHQPRGSTHGSLHEESCEGAPVIPARPAN